MTDISGPTDFADITWRSAAETRIATHRTAAAAWRLVQADGTPVRGPVAVELVDPAFKLGCCLAKTLTNSDPAATRYRAWLDRRIDIAVSENAMKWYSLGAQPDAFAAATAEAELAWCSDQRIPMRGHCLLWSKEKFVQPWVRELSPVALEGAIAAHLQATLERFGPRVSCFDSLNEMLDGDFFLRRLGADAHIRLHQLMNAIAPTVPLFVNEYSIIDNDAKLARYLALIGQLRQAGVRLGGIGVQEHAAERFVPLTQRLVDDNPERQGMAPLIAHDVWDRFDRLSATGLPIHITEVSFRTGDDLAKAEALERFVLTAAAHPAVECFLIWGFWEKAHWLGRTAAFVDGDWNELEPARRWDALRARFTTKLTVNADHDGRIAFTGFKGTYRLRTGAAEARAVLNGKPEPRTALSTVVLT